MLDRAVAMGFRGIVVDRRGYEGSRELNITVAAGRPAFVSPDGTLAFYDLREYARRARARLGAAGLRAVRAEALRDHGRAQSSG